VSGRTETLPFLGQAVLVGGHLPQSRAAAAGWTDSLRSTVPRSAWYVWSKTTPARRSALAAGCPSPRDSPQEDFLRGKPKEAQDITEVALRAAKVEPQFSDTKIQAVVIKYFQRGRTREGLENRGPKITVIKAQGTTEVSCRATGVHGRAAISRRKYQATVIGYSRGFAQGQLTECQTSSITRSRRRERARPLPEPRQLSCGASPLRRGTVTARYQRSTRGPPGTSGAGRADATRPTPPFLRDQRDVATTVSRQARRLAE
jgi:hypothetical protein